MKNITEVIKNRRSVRKYLTKNVEREKILNILKSGMQAPSAWNTQPWEFFVVEDRDHLQKLSDVCKYSKMVADAPVAIVLACNKSRLKEDAFWQQDLGACAQSMLLECVNQDLGGVWIGVAPYKERMDYISNLLNLDNNIDPFCIISLGYPDGDLNYFKDRYNSEKIHFVSEN